MDKEELFINNPNSKDYILKVLLRDIKTLDEKLTKYLVNNFYQYEECRYQDVINEVENINDITNYIIEHEKNEIEDYKNYFKGNTEKYIISKNDQFNAWKSLLEIKEILNTKISSSDISISFHKGFDFGFGNSNFTYLRVSYVENKEHCHQHIQIMSISTHAGKRFSIYKNEDYYKLANLNLENYRLGIDRSIDIETKDELIEKVIELIDGLLKGTNDI